MTAVHVVALALLFASNYLLAVLLLPLLRDAHRRGVQRVRRDTGGPLRGAWTVPMQRQPEGRSWE